MTAFAFLMRAMVQEGKIREPGMPSSQMERASGPADSRLAPGDRAPGPLPGAPCVVTCGILLRISGAGGLYLWMESCLSRHSTPMEPLMFDDAAARRAAASNSAGERAGAARRDTETIAALFESEESALLHYAIGIVRRRIVAEELVQEAFLRLHKVWDQVDNPRGWLYRSVRNLALNHLRDTRRETQLDDSTAQDDALPRELLGRYEAIGTVRMLLSEMPEDDRNLIRLKYDDGLRYQEISRRTGLSVGNVGFRLHHALKGLLDGLQRAGIEGSQG